MDWAHKQVRMEVPETKITHYKLKISLFDTPLETITK